MKNHLMCSGANILFLLATISHIQAEGDIWTVIPLTEEAWFFDTPGEEDEYELSWIELTDDGFEAVLHKGTGFIAYISDVIECGTRPVHIEADVEVSSANVALALIGMNSDAADYASVYGTFGAVMPISARGFEESGVISINISPEGGYLGIALQAALPDAEAYSDWVFVNVKEVRYSILSGLTDTELAYVVDPARRPTPTPSPTPSLTPSGPTYTPTDTPTPTETGTPTATSTPTPTATFSEVITVEVPGLSTRVEQLAMSIVNSGTFAIGSPEDELGRSANESPQHAVVLTEPYYIGQHEITNAQFAAFLNAEGNASSEGSERIQTGIAACRIDKDEDDGDWEVEDGYEDYPAVAVTWYGARDFCAWLTEEDGVSTYRLPTEAEWEHAYRAGTVTRFFWGEDVSNEAIGGYAWYSTNAGAVPHPVGGKSPNAWGLYDMAGNVWEWCADKYGAYEEGTQTDPTGASSGEFYVMRGGAYSSNASDCRAAARARNTAADSWSGLGFRIAATYGLPPTPTPTPTYTSTPTVTKTPTRTPTPTSTPNA